MALQSSRQEEPRPALCNNRKLRFLSEKVSAKVSPRDICGDMSSDLTFVT